MLRREGMCLRNTGTMYLLVSIKTISERSYNTGVKIVAFREEPRDLGWLVGWW